MPPKSTMLEEFDLSSSSSSSSSSKRRIALHAAMAATSIGACMIAPLLKLILDYSLSKLLFRIGGCDAKCAISTTMAYDIDSNQWQLLPPMSTAHYHHAAATI